jgi:HAD superfamily hydrolase (TIGR01459 family)
MTIPILAGLAPIAERYDALILDLWGVVHDGRRPYPGALPCLEQLRAAGKRRLFLSNAPRLATQVARFLERLGIVEGRHYDHLVSSGDVAREALERRDDAWHAALGRRYFQIGPERDVGLLEGLDYRPAATVGEAQFLLNTGFFDDESEGVEDYDALFAEALARGLPMVCANPDLSVMRGDREVPCAGTLAAAYAARGGDVGYHGKPHPRAYQICFRRLEGLSRRRTLVLGDSLRTDMAGAQALDLDAVLVTGGIHADELGSSAGAAPTPERIEAACAGAGVRPLAAMAALVW